MLTDDELALSGYYRGHEVADQIVPISRCVPELAIEIYRRLYSYREMSTEQMPMGSSVVVPMQTNRHDMYGSAYHNLEKGLPEIFLNDPETATRAVARVLSSDVAELKPGVRFKFTDVEIITGGKPESCAEDLERVIREKPRLLVVWCQCLRKLSESPKAGEIWSKVAEALSKDPSAADVWAAVLNEASHQPALFQSTVWPMLHSSDLLSCLRFKKHIETCVGALGKTSETTVLKSWQEVVLGLTRDDLRRRDYKNTDDLLEILKSSYLLCLPESALGESARKYLTCQCKPENLRKPHGPYSRDLTPDERLIIERRENGLNPDNPLHLQIEKDLASLQPPHLDKIDPSILKRIDEIGFPLFQG